MIRKVHFIMQQMHTYSTPRAASSGRQRKFSKLTRWEGKRGKVPRNTRKTTKSMAAAFDDFDGEDGILHLFDDDGDRTCVTEWQRAHEDPADVSMGLPEGDVISDDEEVAEIESVDDESSEDRLEAADKGELEMSDAEEEGRFTVEALKEEALGIVVKLSTGVLKRCAVVGGCGCALAFGDTIERIAKILAEPSLAFKRMPEMDKVLTVRGLLVEVPRINSIHHLHRVRLLSVGVVILA